MLGIKLQSSYLHFEINKPLHFINLQVYEQCDKYLNKRVELWQLGEQDLEGKGLENVWLSPDSFPGCYSPQIWVAVAGVWAAPVAGFLKKKKKMLTWLPVEITGHKKLSNREQRAPRKSPSNKRELKQCIAATKTQPRQVESSPVGSGWKDITCSVSFKRCWMPLFWNRKESFSSMTKYFKTPAVRCDDAKAWKPGRAGRLGDLTWDVFAAFT